MKAVHINFSGIDMDYRKASSIASTLADKDKDLIEPIMVAWHDKRTSRMSPVVEGGDVNTRWHDYGASHGGKMEVDINGEFDFIFADGSAFESYETSPYINLHDQRGNEYLCQINALRDPRNPSQEACVVLDEWTSKLT
ncbi:MAG TPA: AF1514 family protein [Sulfuricella sp.]|nr:AF1514 family protein [Sulfuricella sp.]